MPATQSLKKVMSLRNLLLMQILRNRKKSPLTEIVKDFRKLGMSKPPTKTSIYANLQKLANQNQVEITWEKNNKFYRLSTSGLNELAEIESLLKVGK
jgi:DNA-binding PadR family transcriptional regulator